MFSAEDVLDYYLFLLYSVDTVYDAVDLVETFGEVNGAADKLERTLAFFNDSNLFFELLVGKFIDDEVLFRFTNFQLFD